MTLRQPNIQRMLQLGLTGMAEAMEQQMDLPGSTDLDFDDRLAMLLEREINHRNQRSYLAHLRSAQLRMRADLQDVDCRAGRGISRTVSTQLGAGDWIRNAHNLAISGAAGYGKSFLLCALAHQACRQQRSVLYRRMPELVADLARVRGTSRQRRKSCGGTANLPLLRLERGGSWSSGEGATWSADGNPARRLHDYA